MTKDLGDVIYENGSKVNKALFVNTHGSELMTTLLVVVPKKQQQKFYESYEYMLIIHNKGDIENWTKKTKANITHQNQNIEDEGEKNAIIEEEFKRQETMHHKRMGFPGVIPSSYRGLELEDADGN